MRWDDFRRSDNVEDDRGSGGGFGGGGGIGIPVGGGGLGIGTVVVLGLIGWALGIDPSILIGGAEIVNSGRHSEQPLSAADPAPTGTPKDQMGDFVAAVLGNTEDTWTEIFKDSGQQLSRAAAAAVLRLRCRAAAASRRRRWGRSIVRTTGASISTPLSSVTCASASVAARGKACEFAAGLCDCARGRPSRAEPARHSAEGAECAACGRQQGGGQPHPGAGRAAGGLLRRRLGQPLQPALEVHRAGRRRSGVADRGGDRRRPAAAAVAGLRRARRLHPWLIGSSASAGSRPA